MSGVICGLTRLTLLSMGKRNMGNLIRRYTLAKSNSDHSLTLSLSPFPPLDTYVKVTFSKGNKVLKVKKTGIKQETSEPFFNESFNITTTLDDLPSCSLLLSVYLSTGNDSEGEDGNLIGRVLLGGMMYARGKELDHWTEMICQPRTIVKYWHSLAR